MSERKKRFAEIVSGARTSVPFPLAMFLLVRIIKSIYFTLTSVVNGVRHHRFQGKGKGSFFISLEKDLKRESDTVEVYALCTRLVRETGCKSKLQNYCKPN